VHEKVFHGVAAKTRQEGTGFKDEENIPPKALIFSDFCCTFAMPLMILLVFICSTKVSEKSDMAKSWATFCCPGNYKES